MPVPCIRLAWVILVAALWLCVACEPGERRSQGDPRQVASVAEALQSIREAPDTNVLFVLIDTLRADRLSAYGYPRETSPTLDYMAGTGIRFANHLSQSTWTKTSMASLWTGLYPVRTQVLYSRDALPPEATLPAEIFRDAGFRTAGVWRNGWVASNFGFRQGFEVYHRPQVRHTRRVGVKRDNPHATLEGTDEDVVDTAIEFLRTYGRERWFLYVHLMDVHQYLYDVNTALFGSSYSDIYDNSILHTDNIVGRLLTYLADEDLLQKTLVVWTSDHGEAFSERGFEGHARHVYRETTEVPFVLGLPFVLNPGLVVPNRTRNVDVWPTVLDLLGLPALPDTDGRSLLPQLLAAARNETIDDGGPGFAHLVRGWGRADEPDMPAVAVVDRDFRFVVERERGKVMREELFDRSQDRLEQRDVRVQHPEVASRLRELVTRYFESEPAPWGVDTPRVEIDQMELNQLRALGYAVP